MKKLFILAVTLALFGTSFANVDNGGKKRKKQQQSNAANRVNAARKTTKVNPLTGYTQRSPDGGLFFYAVSRAYS